MSKATGEKKQGKWSKAFKTGAAATGFITAILVVLIVCYIFQIDMATVGVGLCILIAVVVGIPLLIFTLRDNNDEKDENETSQPILKRFYGNRNAKRLVKDYEEWTQGEHSTYTRVHFGGDVVAELQEAKEYEEALRILDSLEGIDMKARERYDYETYRDQVKPQLLESIEKEEKRAAERARNKNLR